jgi:signal transduction histidine kinase
MRLKDIIDRIKIEKQSVLYESDYEYQGHKEYFNVNISPVLENDVIIGFIIAAINITDKKLNELERHKLISDLMQRNRDLEQFAYIVSHNLRAPVTNILGLTYLFKSDQFNTASLPRVIEGLSDAAKKLDDVIIDLDETLRIRRQIKDKFEWILLDDIMKDIWKVKEPIIKEKNIQFTVNFSQVNSIYSVRSYLLNIFTQIIRNSIKFSRPDVRPEIHIWTEKNDHFIMIHFLDNGEGIDTVRYQDQLFGLYKRFNLQSEGRGVGLFMVKNQVETLNGTIELKSKPGEGTHIIIQFPIL